MAYLGALLIFAALTAACWFVSVVRVGVSFV